MYWEANQKIWLNASKQIWKWNLTVTDIWSKTEREINTFSISKCLTECAYLDETNKNYWNRWKNTLFYLKKNGVF